MKRLLVTLFALTALSSEAFAGKILLVRTDAEEMKIVQETIKKDLSSHEIKELVVSKTSTASDLKSAIEKDKPDLLALLDNKALTLLKELQEKEKTLKIPPAAATMALNLKKRIPELKNASGIAFEVPPLTVLTRFRTLTGSEIKNVLAPYRASDFKEAMSEAQSQLAKEGITLHLVDADKAGKDTGAINKLIESALTDTYQGKKIDAILIPTDNLILNKEGFASVWVAKAKSLKVPFVCNVEKFTATSFDFCTYAAYPDFVDLGHQYAEQIAEIIDNGTPAGDLGVDYIVAAKEVINVEKAKKIGLKVSDDKLGEVKKAE